MFKAANAGFAYSHVMVNSQPYNLGIVSALPFDILGQYGPNIVACIDLCSAHEIFSFFIGFYALMNFAMCVFIEIAACLRTQVEVACNGGSLARTSIHIAGSRSIEDNIFFFVLETTNNHVNITYRQHKEEKI